MRVQLPLLASGMQLEFPASPLAPADAGEGTKTWHTHTKVRTTEKISDVGLAMLFDAQVSAIGLDHRSIHAYITDSLVSYLAIRFGP